MLEYFVDCSVAMALQVAGPGNRVHDKELATKVRKAMLGEEESDDDIPRPATKKHKCEKDKGEKAAKKKDSDSESDDGSGDDAGTDSDGESDSDDE